MTKLTSTPAGAVLVAIDIGRCDLHRLAGRRVAAFARDALLDLELAEAAQRHLVVAGRRCVCAIDSEDEGAQLFDVVIAGQWRFTLGGLIVLPTFPPGLRYRRRGCANNVGCRRLLF